MRALREATEADLPAMREIYNDVVRTSDAIFTETERSPVEHGRWWPDRVDANLPVLVAVEDSVVVGYASYGPFRPWPGYRHTVEPSRCMCVPIDAAVGTAERYSLNSLLARARRTRM